MDPNYDIPSTYSGKCAENTFPISQHSGLCNSLTHVMAPEYFGILANLLQTNKVFALPKTTLYPNAPPCLPSASFGVIVVVDSDTINFLVFSMCIS